MVMAVLLGYDMALPFGFCLINRKFISYGTITTFLKLYDIFRWIRQLQTLCQEMG